MTPRPERAASRCSIRFVGAKALTEHQASFGTSSRLTDSKIKRGDLVEVGLTVDPGVTACVDRSFGQGRQTEERTPIRRKPS